MILTEEELYRKRALSEFSQKICIEGAGSFPISNFLIFAPFSANQLADAFRLGVAEDSLVSFKVAVIIQELFKLTY